MAGTAVTSAFTATAVSAPTRAAIGWGTDRQTREQRIRDHQARDHQARERQARDHQARDHQARERQAHGRQAHGRQAHGPETREVPRHAGRVPEQQPRLRLTRRGRIVRMSVLIVLAWLAVGLVATTASHADGPTGPLPTTVVQQGDTLWTIAARTRPEADPFAMIEEIRALNDLDSYTIHPGQELRLPRTR